MVVDLFEDRQLMEGGGMVETHLKDGRSVPLPKIPLRMNGHDFGLRMETPAIGEGARAFLADLGYDVESIARLVQDSVLEIDEVETDISAPA